MIEFSFIAKEDGCMGNGSAPDEFCEVFIECSLLWLNMLQDEKKKINWEKDSVFRCVACNNVIDCSLLVDDIVKTRTFKMNQEVQFISNKAEQLYIVGHVSNQDKQDMPSTARDVALLRCRSSTTES